jgi:hypothetical protein
MAVEFMVHLGANEFAPEKPWLCIWREGNGNVGGDGEGDGDGVSVR